MNSNKCVQLTNHGILWKSTTKGQRMLCSVRRQTGLQKRGKVKSWSYRRLSQLTQRNNRLARKARIQNSRTGPVKIFYLNINRRSFGQQIHYNISFSAFYNLLLTHKQRRTLDVNTSIEVVLMMNRWQHCRPTVNIGPGNTEFMIWISHLI